MKRARDLVVEGQMKDNRRDRCHCCKDKKKHDGDKPGDAALILGRWLGDAKGIDEGIRQKEQRAHGDWMILQGQENRLYASGMPGVHLIERRTCGSGNGRDCGVD